MDIITKNDNSHDFLLLIEKWQEITKPGNFQFNFDSNLNQKVWVPDNRTRDENMRWEQVNWSCCSETTKNKQMRRRLFRIQQTKSGFEYRANKQKAENVSNTEEIDVLNPSANFPNVDKKDNDIAEKTIHYIQVNHVIEKPKAKKAETKNFLGSWIQLYGCFRDPHTQDFGWSETAASEVMREKPSKNKSPRKNFFPFRASLPNNSARYLRAAQSWSPSTEKTSNGRVPLPTPELNENAGREHFFLVIGDERKHWQ